MGPRSIFTLLFTPTIYFPSLLSKFHFYLLRWSFVNDKARGNDNSSVLVGSKVICCCVQVHVKRRDTYLYFLRVLRRKTLVSSPREIAATLHLNLPLGVTNDGRQAIKQFLAPLPGNPVYKIGELHTIFYICFLVLLVYLSIFTFVSLIKNTKNTCCYYGFQWKHQVVWLY